MRNICCSQRAFTLLEVIIVLVILGFIAGLAVPRLEKVYTSVQQSMQRSEVLRSIAGLGYQAWLHQQTFLLSEYPPAVEAGDGFSESETQRESALIYPELQFPANWRVVADPPIRYSYNGVCYGGMLTVFFGDLASRYTLRPPFCFPEQADESGIELSGVTHGESRRSS